jgi:hypothetical protein
LPFLRRPQYSLLTLAIALAIPASASAAELHSASSGDAAASPKETLSDAIHAKAGQAVGGRKLDVTLALHSLSKQLPDLHGADRRRADALFARPTSEDTANPGEETYQPGTTERSVCGTHFCIHWVDTTSDAPNLADNNGDGTPDYVTTMLGVFENVYNVENVQMGWKPPKPDGKKGGSELTDVYIKNIGPNGIFGYAAPDAGQSDRNHQYAYLVMDNDYAQAEFPRYPTPLEPMEVTAAHEYNHVLQFNYDANEDNWMFESTATWMEDKVYDDINDYVSYLTPWSKFSTIPLTKADPDDNNLNNKIYGDAVWNRWIDAHFGADVVRRAWEVSTDQKSFAPGAYDKALKDKGASFFDAFTQFASDTAEWNVGDQLFEEGATFPDMERLPGVTLTPTPDGGASGPLDHTAYALINVDPQGQAQLNLSGAVPTGTKGGVALVTRTGPQVGGQANVQLAKLPRGGRGTVTLDNPSQYSRITAVIINADISKRGYSSDLGDWVFKKDGQGISLALNDSTAPVIASRSPGNKKKGVSTGSKVSVKFSEVVLGANSKTVKLTGPHGRTVKIRIADSAASGITKLKLSPTRRLAAHTKYTVRIGSLVDAAGNKLSGTKSWSFTTK